MKVNKFRKKWLILPAFQLHFMNHLTILFAITIMIFIGHTFYYFQELRNLGFLAQLPPDHIYYSFIDSVAEKYLITSISALCIAGVLFYAFGVYYSNKIAGPIYRFTKSLDELQKDPKAKVSFKIRKDDYFKELSEKLEVAINKNDQH